MLPVYTVTAIKLGSIRVDKSSPVHGFPSGTTIDIPIWGAAVEGNGHKMLVDTGLQAAARWSTAFAPHFLPDDEGLGPALAELGWSLSDIDIVINTHLHYDHSANNLLLPHAQFFISRYEWDFAKDPTNTQAWAYSHEWTGPELTFMNYTLTSTDHYDVMPGLRLIQTPGHTPGHHSVLINTNEGLLCVTGDAANMLENLSVPTPPGVFVSSREALNSIKKICDLSDRVLPSHDPGIGRFQSSGFPTSPSPV